MDCNKIEMLLAGYADSSLHPPLRAEVEAHLKECSRCRKELEDTRFLLGELDGMVDETPPASLRENFLKELEKARKQEDNSRRRITIGIVPLQAAASVALLLAGFLVGMLAFRNDKEEALMATQMEQMKSEMVQAKLFKTNASERMQAISLVSGTAQPQAGLMQALVHTMNTDEHVNVRLAAITALSEYMDNAYVRNELLASLDKQKNPLLQIALIEILTGSGDQKAGKKIRELSENEEVDPLVQEQARKASEMLL